jgi:hypothetical protein
MKYEVKQKAIKIIEFSWHDYPTFHFGMDLKMELTRSIRLPQKRISDIDSRYFFCIIRFSIPLYL